MIRRSPASHQCFASVVLFACPRAHQSTKAPTLYELVADPRPSTTDSHLPGCKHDELLFNCSWVEIVESSDRLDPVYYSDFLSAPLAAGLQYSFPFPREPRPLLSSNGNEQRRLPVPPVLFSLVSTGGSSPTCFWHHLKKIERCEANLAPSVRSLLLLLSSTGFRLSTPAVNAVAAGRARLSRPVLQCNARLIQTLQAFFTPVHDRSSFLRHNFSHHHSRVSLYHLIMCTCFDAGSIVVVLAATHRRPLLGGDLGDLFRACRRLFQISPDGDPYSIAEAIDLLAGPEDSFICLLLAVRVRHEYLPSAPDRRGQLITITGGSGAIISGAFDNRVNRVEPSRVQWRGVCCCGW